MPNVADGCEMRKRVVWFLHNEAFRERFQDESRRQFGPGKIPPGGKTKVRGH